MERLKEKIREHFGTGTVEVASLGGTATWGICFPEDITDEAVTVARVEGIQTPFGECAPIKLLRVDGKPVVRCQHQVAKYGKPGVFPSANDQLQAFWVLYQLGVKRVLVDGSGGGITARQGDILIMTDYLDLQSNPEVAEFGRVLGLEGWKRMANPFCSELRSILLQEINRVKPVYNRESNGFTIGRIIDHGVYATSFPGVFESAAQIQLYKLAGVDMVGQTLGLVAKLARVCDMCLGAIHVVSNDAEGLSEDLGEISMQDFYTSCGKSVGLAVWNALKRAVNLTDYHCKCQSYKKEMSDLPVPDVK